MDFYIISGDSKDHGLPAHVLWPLHVPCNSAWSLMAIQTTDVNMASGGNRQHRHHMVFDGTMGHGYQHSLQL